MALAVASCLGITAASTTSGPTSATEWRLDNLAYVGGHAVTLAGAPKVVQTEIGAAVEFNGSSDGIFLDTDPLAGLQRFTIEVLFQPAADGPAEQRFLHLEDPQSGRRGLIELRMSPGGRFALDTFALDGDRRLTLLDRSRTHAAGAWHVAALTYDGKTLTHYVDGVRELSGEVALQPHGGGRTSIGVRQNRVSWFKGRIHTIRVTADALPADRLLGVPAVTSERRQTIPLWPEGVPDARAGMGSERIEDSRVYNVQIPTLTYVPATGRSTGTAVIVCPGGSYTRLSIVKEGEGIAAELAARGIVSFVLRYRLVEYGHPAPLRDVLRAVRLVRSRAGEFGVRPDRIGVLGFSAGGHLAASAATLFDAAEGRTGAQLDGISARPDFAGLVYPVITMAPPFAHQNSRRNLLGGRPSQALAERMSLERQVGPRTPPVFLVHTAEDKTVPVENSVVFYEALRRAGVPAQLQLYQHGPHGFAGTPDLGPASAWLDRFVEWMAAYGWAEARTSSAPTSPGWARGIEGQRKADLGNGSYLNPIVSGDRPDPSILKDGDDYYMTFSSFDAYPGLVIWQSRDLVNWKPIGPALFKNVGSVWAPELIKHRGRYYIYFPGIAPYRSIYVIWADDIRGPWSEPIDLKNRRIDPGHAVGPDGTRYLFLSAGYLVRLADDGLSIVGEEKKIYEGWQYPKDWIVEAFAQEGPKILKRGDYYYQVLAQGGTAGPPTGHMIVATRSKTIEGPWENSPYNPIVRTQSSTEHWWSKGHGTLVEGPDGRWWMVYHAYENGFYNLGRQALLQPIEWLVDGWFRVTHDPDRPIPKPAPSSTGEHGFAFSDDFSTDRMGVQWSFYKGTDVDRTRYRRENGALVLKAKGTSPSDSSPLWFVTGDQAYEFEVEIDADPETTAGVLLFYNQRLYVGLGYSSKNLIMHSYGLDRLTAKPPQIQRTLHLRLRNDRHIVTIHYSLDGKTWERYDRGMEVSGYHHNVGYDFLSLRPALYAAGSGEVRFRNFKYRALP